MLSKTDDPLRHSLWTFGVAATLSAFLTQGAWAQTSSGTAFAVAPDYLITNQHVVAGCSSVEVTGSDGRRRGAIMVADVELDLALLRVSGLKGTVAKLRNPRAVRLAEQVNVFGYPMTGSLSSGGNFTTGIVSALRGLRDAAGEIQITAPVQPGNSGGPVLDRSGPVIGVIQSKLDALRAASKTGDIPQNVNFAISLDVLAAFLEKHQISFQSARADSAVDPSIIAEQAQAFTYRVTCEPTNRQSTREPDSSWTRYTNERFGTSIEYPVDLFANPILPANGDGIRFDANRDGATLRIWGGFNVLNQTPYQNICMDGCPGEVYRVDQRQMAVSSGIWQGAIYYQKCFLMSGANAAFHCFRLQHPSSQKPNYEAVIIRMSNSLR